MLKIDIFLLTSVIQVSKNLIFFKHINLFNNLIKNLELTSSIGTLSIKA